MSRGPGRIERAIIGELERCPNGAPLRLLAAIAYGASPHALSKSQLTSVRQILSRLASRHQAVALDERFDGVKLWYTAASARAEVCRRRQAAKLKAKAQQKAEAAARKKERQQTQANAELEERARDGTLETFMRNLRRT
jgi:hypothetical protein